MVLTVALKSKSQGTDVEVVGGVETEVIFVAVPETVAVVWLISLILISVLIVVAIADVVVDAVSVVAPEEALAFTICG